MRETTGLRKIFKQENIRVGSEFQKDNSGGIVTNRGKEGNSMDRETS